MKKTNWTCLDFWKFIMDMFIYAWGAEAGGWGKAGTLITLKYKIPGWNVLSEKLYIYVYTHIHIYTYIQVTTYQYLVVKKYRLFYNNSTIDFIIIHSNFLIHTVVVEIGTPALSNVATFLVSTRYAYFSGYGKGVTGDRGEKRRK